MERRTTKTREKKEATEVVAEITAADTYTLPCVTEKPILVTETLFNLTLQIED
jgi:hypothetical protein